MVHLRAFCGVPAWSPLSAATAGSSRCAEASASNSVRCIMVAFAMGRAETSSPPQFLRLAGHPLRWRLLASWPAAIRAVGELTELVGQRQSLVSYHLGRLRDGGLVSVRRSTADGRDTYYALDLARCGDLLRAPAASLHPGLAAATGAAGAPRLGDARGAVPVHRQQRPLADGRGAARAAVRRRGRRAASAGSHPKPLHPERGAGDARRAGSTSRGRRTKHLDEFAGAALRPRRSPSATGSARSARSSPARRSRSTGASPTRPRAGRREPLPAFERTAAELDDAHRFLLAAIARPTPRRSATMT